jgi:TatD DNase family protein
VLTDTHCHLDFEAFNMDRNEVLERSKDAGIHRILNPGIDLETSRRAIRLAEAHAQVFAAIGVHPHDALSWNEDTNFHLRKLAEGSKVVAIGEIGLDYYRNRSPHEQQRRVFLEQLALAAELGLPVVIHNRQATQDVLALVSEWHGELVRSGSPLAQRPGVMHSFSDGEDFARQAIEMNFYIGFSGPVTFQNARDLQQVAAALPLDHILVETDAPFLTPHPHRGQRNEPAYVHYVAEKIAALHQISYSKTAEITTASAARLFAW